MKEKSEKAGLKFNIQKTKIMASGPSLHGKQMGKSGNGDRFIFLGSKITANCDCSHEIKTFALWEKKFWQTQSAY